MFSYRCKTIPDKNEKRVRVIVFCAGCFNDKKTGPGKCAWLRLSYRCTKCQYAFHVNCFAAIHPRNILDPNLESNKKLLLEINRTIYDTEAGILNGFSK